MKNYTHRIRDMGEGNGFAVLSHGSLLSTHPDVEVIEDEEDEECGPGIIKLNISTTCTGAFSLEHENEFLLTPEEAQSMAESLLEAAKLGEAVLLARRQAKAARTAAKKNRA